MNTDKIKVVVLDKAHVDLIREVLENKKDKLVCVSATSKNLQYGQYLITESENFNEEERLFRLVQIREGKGYFGSVSCLVVARDFTIEARSCTCMIQFFLLR